MTLGCRLFRSTLSLCEITGAALNRRPRPYLGRALSAELPGHIRRWPTTQPELSRRKPAICYVPSQSCTNWSGKRDSNPRPRAWKARALPTELFPQTKWWRGKDSNLRRHSRQIYSLLPLATREPLLFFLKHRTIPCPALPTSDRRSVIGISTKTIFLYGAGDRT